MLGSDAAVHAGALRQRVEPPRARHSGARRPWISRASRSPRSWSAAFAGVFASGGTEANNLFIKGAAALSEAVADRRERHRTSVRREAGAGARAARVESAQACRNAGGRDRPRRPRCGAGGADRASSPSCSPTTRRGRSARGGGRRAGAAARAWMHTDAVQALGKIDVDFRALNVHAMTLSAHKIYGPRARARWSWTSASSCGRSSTAEATSRACARARKTCRPSSASARPASSPRGARTSWRRASKRCARDWNGLTGWARSFSAQRAPRIPNTTYFAFQRIDGETLVIELDKLGFAVAAGAACSSASTEPRRHCLRWASSPSSRAARCASPRRGETEAGDRRFLAALAEGLVARLQRA